MIAYTVEVFSNGDRLWYLNGKFHREDGPAVEYKNGNKFWYFNDKLHRVGAPAVEYADGSKSWYQNDQLHRVDGPAIEYADGTKCWYITGIRYTQEEFDAKIKEMKRLTNSSCAGKVVEIDGKKYKLVEA